MIMQKQCKACGRPFEWSDLGQFALEVMNRILAHKARDEILILCPTCRRNDQLQLFRRRPS